VKKKKNSTWVFFRLGNHLYVLQSVGELVKIPVEEGRAMTDMLGSWLGDNGPASVGVPCHIVWEPFDMIHEVLNAPRVNRRTFATLADVGERHPEIKNESHGWGVDPMPAGTGAGRTRLHVEGTPELHEFGQKLEASGFDVKAAWPLATVALAAVGRERGDKMDANVVVVSDGMVGIFTKRTGQPLHRGELSILDMQDATGSPVAALYQSLSSAGLFSNASQWTIFGDTEDIQAISIKLEESAASYAAGWEAALAKTPRHSFESLGVACVALGANHTANLWHAFPRPFGLDGILKGVAVVALLVAAFIGLQWNSTRKAAAEALEIHQSSMARMGEQERRLQENANEIKRLTAGLGPDSIMPKNRGRALAVLGGEAIPENYTLTHLSIDKDGNIQLGAIRLSDGADKVALLAQLQRMGFVGCEVIPNTGKPNPDEPERVTVRAKIKEE
jgi:hypothetical protein